MICDGSYHHLFQIIEAMEVSSELFVMHSFVNQILSLQVIPTINFTIDFIPPPFYLNSFLLTVSLRLISLSKLKIEELQLFSYFR